MFRKQTVVCTWSFLRTLEAFVQQWNTMAINDRDDKHVYVSDFLRDHLTGVMAWDDDYNIGLTIAQYLVQSNKIITVVISHRDHCFPKTIEAIDKNRIINIFHITIHITLILWHITLHCTLLSKCASHLNTKTRK